MAQRRQRLSDRHHGQRGREPLMQPLEQTLDIVALGRDAGKMDGAPPVITVAGRQCKRPCFSCTAN